MRNPADIGTELVRLRTARGWTQGELAARLGVKRQQVQRWEACAYRAASLERVGRVADALGWRPSPGDVAPEDACVAAETACSYEGGRAAIAPPPAADPVRDLGEVIARVRAYAPELRRRFTVRSVGVFGSFARGEQSGDSDVDLVVEVDSPTLENVFGAEIELERILGRRTEAGSLSSMNPRVLRGIEEELVGVWSA